MHRKYRNAILFIIFESLNLQLHIQVNLCQKLFFLQNMGTTCCVQKLFWMSETISVHNMFSPGLSLEFPCIEPVIQWMSSYCGLFDAKIRASDKDLPVLWLIYLTHRIKNWISNHTSVITYSSLQNRHRAGNKHKAWKIWQKGRIAWKKNQNW